jgi:hypothetical protein
MSEVRQPSPVTYSLGDFYALTVQGWRVWLGIVAAIALLLYLLPVALALADGWTLEWAMATADWILPTIAIAFLIAFIVAIVAIKYWLAVRRGLIEPTTILATPDGLEIASARIHSSVKWAAITRIVRTRSRVFLFLAPRAAVISPRRSFDSDEQFEAWAVHAERLWQTSKP